MADQINSLILRVQGEEEIKDLTRAIEQDREALVKLNDEFQAGILTQDQFLSASQKSASAMVVMEKRVAELQKSNRNLGMATMETGRIIQDFAQGGFAGILNNIEGLSRALGGGPGLAGVLTGLGVAAYFVLPRIRDFFSAITAGSNEVPKSKDRVKAMNDELERANKELKDMEGKESLTNKELARFNELTEKAAKLQKDLNEQKEREARLEKLRQQKAPEQEEAAEWFGGLIGGPDVDKLIADVKAQLLREGAERGTLGKLTAAAARAARMGMDPREIADRQAAAAAERERLGGEAKRLVDRASEGQKGAVEMLLQHLPARSRFREGLAEITPAALRQQELEQEQFEARGEELHAAGVRRRARRKQDQDLREGAVAGEKARADQDEANRQIDAKQRQHMMEYNQESAAVAAKQGLERAGMIRGPAGAFDMHAAARRLEKEREFRRGGGELGEAMRDREEEARRLRMEVMGKMMGRMNGTEAEIQFLEGINRNLDMKAMPNRTQGRIGGG